MAARRLPPPGVLSPLPGAVLRADRRPPSGLIAGRRWADPAPGRRSRPCQALPGSNRAAAKPSRPVARVVRRLLMRAMAAGSGVPVRPAGRMISAAAGASSKPASPQQGHQLGAGRRRRALRAALRLALKAPQAHGPTGSPEMRPTMDRNAARAAGSVKPANVLFRLGADVAAASSPKIRARQKKCPGDGRGRGAGDDASAPGNDPGYPGSGYSGPR